MKQSHRALAILLCCLLGVSTAHAGGWMRETKKAFVLNASTLRKSQGSIQSNTVLYAEYGLSPRLTIGATLDDTSGTTGHLLAFVRFPLSKPGTGHHTSLELGAGRHYRNGDWFKMFKTTLAYGRGFERRWGQGWVNFEASVERRFADPDLIYKFDTIVGQSSGARLRPMFKLGATHISGQPLALTVSSHLMFDTRKKKSIWVLGVERKTGAVSSTGIGFEIWRTF